MFVCVCIYIAINFFTFDRNTTYGCSFQEAYIYFYLVAILVDS